MQDNLSLYLFSQPRDSKSINLQTSSLINNIPNPPNTVHFKSLIPDNQVLTQLPNNPFHSLPTEHPSFSVYSDFQSKPFARSLPTILRPRESSLLPRSRTFTAGDRTPWE